MKCPKCNAESKVVDSRPTHIGSAPGIRRRRSCTECGERFTSYEFSSPAVPTVRKRDGSVQLFDPGKLLASVVRVCQGVIENRRTIAELVERVEDEAFATVVEDSPVESSSIADITADLLKQESKAAYIRYAAHFRDFVEAGAIEDRLADFFNEMKATSREAARREKQVSKAQRAFRALPPITLTTDGGPEGPEPEQN